MSDEQAAPAAAPGQGADTLGEIMAKQADSAFMGKYLNGDAQAVAEMKALYSKAYPEPNPEAAPEQDEPPAPDPAAAANSEFLAVEMASAYQPPRGSYEYEGLLHERMSAEEISEGMALGQAMFNAGVPVALAHQLRDIGQRLQREGRSEDGEGEKARGMAELERRHGAEAPEIVKLANMAYTHLRNEAPDVADALVEAGIGSDPDAIFALASWARANGGGGS